MKTTYPNFTQITLRTRPHFNGPDNISYQQTTFRKGIRHLGRADDIQDGQTSYRKSRRHFSLILRGIASTSSTSSSKVYAAHITSRCGNVHLSILCKINTHPSFFSERCQLQKQIIPSALPGGRIVVWGRQGWRGSGAAASQWLCP